MFIPNIYGSIGGGSMILKYYCKNNDIGITFDTLYINWQNMVSKVLFRQPVNTGDQIIYEFPPLLQLGYLSYRPYLHFAQNSFTTTENVTC